jgi:hypothetical protein
VKKPKPPNTVYDQTSKRVTFMNKNPANEIASEFAESKYQFNNLHKTSN